MLITNIFIGQMDPLTYVIAGAVGYGAISKIYTWYTGDEAEPVIPTDLLDEIKEGKASLKHVIGTKVDDELNKILEERRKRIAGERNE